MCCWYLTVLLSGGGSVGLTLGIALNKFKVKHVIVEKEDHISDHPKAHYLSPRTVEIFKNLDMEQSLTKQYANNNIENWKHYRYCGYLLDPESYYGAIDHFRPSILLD